MALECVKEAVGVLRVEIDALLSQGLPNSPMAGAVINTVSGNFITAQPHGVRDGVKQTITVPHPTAGVCCARCNFSSVTVLYILRFIFYCTSHDSSESKESDTEVDDSPILCDFSGIPHAGCIQS